MKKIKTLPQRLRADVHLAELISGASTSFIFRMSGLALGYLFALFVSRTLGAETWGIYTLVLALVTFASIIGRLGLDTALLRFNAENKAQNKFGLLKGYNRFAYKIIFIVSVILTVVVYFSAQEIANHIFNKPHLARYFQIGSFAILPLSFSVLSSRALRGFKKVAKGVYLEFISRYLYFLIALVVAFFIKDNISTDLFLWVFVLISYFSFFQGIYWNEKELKNKDNIPISRVDKKKILKVAIPLLLASSMMYFKGWVDTLVIGIYLDEVKVGVYNIALKLSGLIALPLTAINTIAAPKFAENKDNIKELNKVVKKSTKIITYTATPIFLLLIIFPNYLLGFFGADFEVGVVALRILSMSVFFNAISGSVGYLLQMTGEQVMFQNISIVAAMLSIAFNFIFIPYWGINGAALSSLIVMVLWNSTMILYIKKRTNILTIYIPLKK